MKQLEELTETNKKLQAQVEKLEDEKRILSEANIVLQGMGLFSHVTNHECRWLAQSPESVIYQAGERHLVGYSDVGKVATVLFLCDQTVDYVT